MILERGPRACGYLHLFVSESGIFGAASHQTISMRKQYFNVSMAPTYD
jgi:hypothetical protein